MFFLILAFIAVIYNYLRERYKLIGGVDMAACKKYTNKEGATLAYRERPTSDCQNCAYFSSKNCGTHGEPAVLI